MSVLARSLGSAGRSIFGRPAAASVVALIAATFAVGAPAALAGEPSGGVEAVVADALQVPAAEPVDTPSVDPPPVDLPPVDPPAADPPPVDPPQAADPPPIEMPAADPAPVEVPAADPAPVELSAADAPEAPPPSRSANGGAGAPPASSPGSESGGARSVANNVNRVIQAVWQVQHGCRSHCYGTSQSQRSVQWSQTTQSATAVAGELAPNAPGSSSSSAEARNESVVIQFVWQMQIGCVAFCYETSQTQEASQHSETDQEAIAQSALTAWAENLSETLQYVFQTQEGCEHECHGTAQWQSSTQHHSTNQSSTATGGGEAVAVSSPTFGDDGTVIPPAWLVALAQNLGVTIQTVYQHQEASCQERCWGDAQVQDAVQRALAAQEAVALAAPPPEPPGPEEPPPTNEEPPVQPPSGEQPPAAPLVPETGAPNGQSVTAVLSIRRLTDGPRRGRLELRMVLRHRKVEHRSDRFSLAGGPLSPLGPALAGATPTAAPTNVAAEAPVEPVRRVRSKTRPASTFDELLDPAPGASLGWVVIALLAAALALFGATARQLHRLRHP